MTMYEQALHRKNSSHILGKLVKQKLACAGHVLRGSSGVNALLVLQAKFHGKKIKRLTKKDLDR